MAYHDKVSSLLLETSPMPKRRGQNVFNSSGWGSGRKKEKRYKRVY
uniref:Uncharacterized protein n=1 Tax=Anguilla anguilla TaxID=7936 RepID=A0A0E9RD83_ANGAN